MLVSFANSAFASTSPFLSPASLFLSFSIFSSSMAAMRAASCRSRSARRAGSTSFTLGSSTRRAGPGGDADLRRLEGGCSEFSGERDLQSHYQFWTFRPIVSVCTHLLRFWYGPSEVFVGVRVAAVAMFEGECLSVTDGIGSSCWPQDARVFGAILPSSVFGNRSLLARWDR